MWRVVILIPEYTYVVCSVLYVCIYTCLCATSHFASNTCKTQTAVSATPEKRMPFVHVYVCMHWLAHSAVRDNQPFRVAAMPVMQ